MDKYYVDLGGYGGYGDDSDYTECIMEGMTDPDVVFRSFTHSKVTDYGVDYLAAYHHEKCVLAALIDHFSSCGYSKINYKTYRVGD